MALAIPGKVLEDSFAFLATPREYFCPFRNPPVLRYEVAAPVYQSEGVTYDVPFWMPPTTLLKITGEGSMSLLSESLAYCLAFFACYQYVHCYTECYAECISCAGR